MIVKPITFLASLVIYRIVSIITILCRNKMRKIHGQNCGNNNDHKNQLDFYN